MEQASFLTPQAEADAGFVGKVPFQRTLGRAVLFGQLVQRFRGSGMFEEVEGYRSSRLACGQGKKKRHFRSLQDFGEKHCGYVLVMGKAGIQRIHFKDAQNQFA